MPGGISGKHLLVACRQRKMISISAVPGFTAQALNSAELPQIAGHQRQIRFQRDGGYQVVHGAYPTAVFLQLPPDLRGPLGGLGAEWQHVNVPNEGFHLAEFRCLSFPGAELHPVYKFVVCNRGDRQIVRGNGFNSFDDSRAPPKHMDACAGIEKIPHDSTGRWLPCFGLANAGSEIRILLKNPRGHFRVLTGCTIHVSPWVSMETVPAFGLSCLGNLNAIELPVLKILAITYIPYIHF